MKKTLFIMSALCFASALSHATTEWNGQAEEYYNAVTGADGSKSRVYVLYTRDQNNLTLTTDEASFDISPDKPNGAATATVVSMVSSTEGADFYISPNAWGYSRSFASLTIEEASLQKANLHVLNSNEGGTINATIKKVNGSIGSVINTGTLAIGTSSGEQQTETTFSGTVSNYGSLTLNGSLTFDTTDLSGYTRGINFTKADMTTNGYAESTTAGYYLIRNQGGTLNMENATISNTGAKEWSDGVVIETQDSVSVYCVNSGTVGRSETTDADSIYISDSGVLTSGESSKTAILQGSGVYKLNNGSASLGNVSLDGVKWTGAVELSGNITGSQNFSAFATANSRVRLTGVNTWFSPQTLASNFELVNPDDTTPAFAINGANSGATYGFSGKLTGSGDIAYTQTEARNCTFNFTGDTSEWSGNFIDKNTGTQTISITAGGDSIGMGVEDAATGGTMNLTINGREGATISMKGAVRNTGSGTMNLTMANSAKIQFENTVDVSTFNMNTRNTSVTVAVEASLTAKGGNLIGSISNAGSISLTNAAITGRLDVTGAGEVAFKGGFSGTAGNTNGYSLVVGSGSDGKVSMAEGTFDLSGTSVGVAKNAVLTVKSGATFKADSVKNSGTQDSNGTLVVESGATAAIGTGETRLTSLQTAGTTSLNGTTTITTLEAQGGSIAIGGATTVSTVSTTATTAISVGQNASLTINAGNLTSAITNQGTVNLSGVDVSTLSKEGGTETHIDLDGQATESANYYVGSSAGYVTVVSGGSSTGTNLTWGGKSDWSLTDGKIAVNEATVDYATFYMGESTGVSTSQLNTATTTVDMTNGTLTVDRDLANVVANGGTVNIADGHKVTESLEVAKNATITGKIDADKVGIDAGKTATLTSGLATDTIAFSKDGGVQVTNTAETGKITYGTEETSAKVTADSLTKTGDNTETVANQLAVDSITNSGSGSLLVTGSVDGLQTLAATAGDITLQNVAEQLVVTSLSLGADKAVAIYTGAEASTANEGSIKVTGTLTSGAESTLNANLEIGNGVTLNFAEAKALTLGSTLTVGEGVVLGTDLKTALNELGDGGTLTLVQAKEDTTLGYGNNSYNGLAANTHFNTEGWNGDYDYTIQANNGSFAIVKAAKGDPTPEPTTGTLSLLALAGLMARRRRK